MHFAHITLPLIIHDATRARVTHLCTRISTNTHTHTHVKTHFSQRDKLSDDSNVRASEHACACNMHLHARLIKIQYILHTHAHAFLFFFHFWTCAGYINWHKSIFFFFHKLLLYLKRCILINIYFCARNAITFFLFVFANSCRIYLFQPFAKHKTICTCRFHIRCRCGH